MRYGVTALLQAGALPYSYLRASASHLRMHASQLITDDVFLYKDESSMLDLA